MSNDPKNTPGSAAEPGKSDAGNSQWYVPPGAVPPPPASTPDQPPLPNNPKPDQTGKWYVPAAAVNAASTAAGLSGPEAVPTPSEPIPASNVPAAPAASVPGSDLPGSELAENVNYDNYVPGVGVVNPATAAGNPAPIAAPAVSQPSEPAASASSNAPVFFVPTSSATPAASDVPAQTESPAQPAQPAPSVAAAPRIEVAPPSATESLSQKYTDVEQSVHILRRRYSAGLISSDQLRAELRKLMILDNDGHWWMIGMETDRWYKFNGQDWLLDTPPGRTPLPADLVNVMKPGSPAISATPAASVTPGYNPTMPLIDNSVPAPTQNVTIPLDEYGMPLAPAEAAAQGISLTGSLPQQVPVNDPNATMVGQAAPYLDNTLRSSSTSPMTVVNPAIAQDQYSAAPVDTYLPADSVAAAGPIIHPQPDYGERPGGLVANRSRLGYYLGLAAVVVFFLTLAATLVVLGIAFLGYYNVVNQYDSAIGALPTKAASTFKSVHIMDAAGNMIAEINDPSGGGRRVQVTIGQISPYLIHATVSTEDQRFYQDPGFDVFGIARAVIQNTLAGGTISGASTITQQLARLMVFDPTQIGSATQRKLTEIVVASEISRRYSKDQILEMYLNQIPYGNFSYGIEAAAESYFGIHAKDLNLPQAALLAGLPQSPATYDPVQNRQAAFARMDSVLGLMANTGCLPVTDPHTGQQPLCITTADVNAAAAQKALVEAGNYQPPATNYTHPHFVNYVLQQLEATYGNTIYDAGFNVYTTLDPNLQKVAETAVASQVSQLATRHVTNGAALVIRPSDGAVLAMVGSANFNNKDISGQVNIVLAPRQAGSSLKPFVYLTSFTPGPDGSYMTPATILWDVPNSCFPVTNPPYCPNNYDNTFHGPVSARTALANSYNVPAVKTFQYDTVDRFKVIADQVGLVFPTTNTPDVAGLTTALGATEVRMTDLVSAYATLANQGRRLSGLYSIQRITTGSAGQETEVYNAKDHPIALSQVADPGLTYLVTNILSDNNARLPAFGPGNPLQLANGQPAAVKTGTTSDYRDNWTVGYTPSFVVGVWVGNADDTPMINVSGVTGAGPIWNQIMSAATSGKPLQPFQVPPNVGQTTICADFGTANFSGCPKAGQEVFVTTEPPPTIDKVLQQYAIDQFSGLIANTNCPSFTQTKTFLTLTDTAALAWLNSDPTGQKWAQTHGLTLPLSAPPTAQCDANTPQPIVKIASPAANQSVYSLIQITGTVNVPNFSYYQLELSQASNPNAVAALGDAIHTPRAGDNQYLGGWETTSVPDGQYNLRIHFFDTAGHNAVVSIPIIVNNSNPPLQATAIGVPTTIGGSSGQAIPPTSTPFGPPTIRALFPTAVH